MNRSPPTATNLWLDLAKVFLKLGTTAFGGPAAHMAMMEQEFVHRRGWLSPQAFLDLLGMANLLPGPTSTEMAIFIGYRQAGWIGLLLGGCCFILPAMTLVMLIAWGYVRFGTLPQVASVLYGIKPVIIAILVQALWCLGRTAVKTKWLAIVGIICAGMNWLGMNVLLVLLFGGSLMAAGYAASQPRGHELRTGAIPWFSAGSATPWLFAVNSATTAASFSLWALFLFFLKVGALLFGSGYVLLAFLRADLVEHWRWLTESQLLDAIAVGQFTPGPMFTTATFIGFLLSGFSGAVVATIGIFLPAFLMVAVSGPILLRIRRWPMVGTFLDGVNVAALALMLVVTGQLGVSALTDWITLALALISGLILLRYRVNASWLVLAGGIIGFLVGAWK